MPYDSPLTRLKWPMVVKSPSAGRPVSYHFRRANPAPQRISGDKTPTVSSDVMDGLSTQVDVASAARNCDEPALSLTQGEYEYFPTTDHEVPANQVSLPKKTRSHCVLCRRRTGRRCLFRPFSCSSQRTTACPSGSVLRAWPTIEHSPTPVRSGRSVRRRSRRSCRCIAASKRAVKLVAAGFCGNVDHRTRGLAELGLEAGAVDGHLLDRIERQVQGSGVRISLIPVGGVHAVEEITAVLRRRTHDATEVLFEAPAVCVMRFDQSALVSVM